MSEFTPKSERLGRLITNAPEMYKLLKDLAEELRGCFHNRNNNV